MWSRWQGQSVHRLLGVEAVVANPSRASGLLLTSLLLSLPPSAVCGKPKHPVDQVQRIIGGSMDAKGSFPWQAKKHRSEMTCLGSPGQWEAELE